MAILRRASAPVRAPARRVVAFYVHFFEDLIHAVKSELVDRLNESEIQLEEIGASVATGREAMTDQLAMQAAAVRRIQAELEVLQGLSRDSTTGTRAMLDQLRVDSAAVLAEVSAARDELAAARQDLTERIHQTAPSVRLRELTDARITDIDAPTSWFLNYAGSHAGPLRDVGWWINHPVVIEWSEGKAGLGAVNERIIEQPFVFAAVADLAPGSRILDIGGAESTVGFSLASLGYEVTVIEPQGYPFEHPNLTVFERPLEEFAPEQPFDAIILLSTIEHFGIGHYAGGPEPDPDADFAAMKLIGGLVAPKGRLVLTTPYGPAEVTEVERIYDRQRLMKLLDGWTIHHAAIGRRTSHTTWELEANELEAPAGPGRVVMVVASAPESL